MHVESQARQDFGALDTMFLPESSPSPGRDSGEYLAKMRNCDRKTQIVCRLQSASHRRGCVRTHLMLRCLVHKSRKKLDRFQITGTAFKKRMNRVSEQGQEKCKRKFCSRITITSTRQGGDVFGADIECLLDEQVTRETVSVHVKNYCWQHRCKLSRTQLNAFETDTTSVRKARQHLRDEIRVKALITTVCYETRNRTASLPVVKFVWLENVLVAAGNASKRGLVQADHLREENPAVSSLQ